jgi:hypothetical protein
LVIEPSATPPVSLEICLYDFSPSSSRVATFSLVCQVNRLAARTQRQLRASCRCAASTHRQLQRFAPACRCPPVFAFRASRFVGDPLARPRPAPCSCLRAMRNIQSYGLSCFWCDWFTVAHAGTCSKREASETRALLALQVPERVHDALIMLRDTTRCYAVQENAKRSCSTLTGNFNICEFLCVHSGCKCKYKYVYLVFAIAFVSPQRILFQ